MEKVKDNLNLDLFLVSTIFVLIVQLLCIGLDKLEVKKLEKEMYQAKVIVVELNEELTHQIQIAQELSSINKDLLADITKILDDNQILRELQKVKNRNLTLALCYPENNFSHTRPHLGIYDKNVIGLVCGIKDYWIDIIPEVTEDNINTIYAGEMVLNYLLKKNDGDLVEALKEFKGAKKNMKTVQKTLDIYEELGK